MAAHIAAVAAILFGGLGGAFYTWRRRKTEIALMLSGQMFSIYSDMAVMSRKLIRLSEIEKEKRTDKLSETDIICIGKVGDWFESSAGLYKKKIANRKLLELFAIPSQGANFAAIVTRAFDAEVLPIEEKSLYDWPYLERLRNKLKNRQKLLARHE
jgi:hypothetical protein